MNTTVCRQLPSAALIAKTSACTAAGCLAPATTIDLPLCSARSLASSVTNLPVLSAALPEHLQLFAGDVQFLGQLERQRAGIADFHAQTG